MGVGVGAGVDIGFGLVVGVGVGAGVDIGFGLVVGAGVVAGTGTDWEAGGWVSDFFLQPTRAKVHKTATSRGL